MKAKHQRRPLLPAERVHDSKVKVAEQEERNEHSRQSANIEAKHRLVEPTLHQRRENGLVLRQPSAIAIFYDLQIKMKQMQSNFKIRSKRPRTDSSCFQLLSGRDGNSGF